MADIYVSDTILYAPDRIRDNTLKYAQCRHTLAKEKSVVRRNGTPVIRKVSQEEIERQWR